jgi:hypothetical protein
MKRSGCHGEILVLALFATVLAVPAAAETPCSYYAAPFRGGGGRVPAGEPYATRKAPGTAEEPFRIFDFWKRKLVEPGAVLCLKDGLYRGKHSMIRPPSGDLSGKPGQPVEVRAVNDGQVWIDGEFEHRPLDIRYSYWTVAGLNLYNSIGPAVSVAGGKQTDDRDQVPIHHVTLRRLVGWRDFIPYGSLEDYEEIGGHNLHIFSIADATDVLVEDCAGFGWARKIFQNYRSHRVTFRRSWARWDSRYPYTKSNKFAFACSYKGYDALCENLIATVGGSNDPAAMPPSYEPTIHLIATDRGADPIDHWLDPPDRDRHAIKLRIFGSLAYTRPGARFTDVSGFHIGGSGYPHKGQKGVRIENSVAVIYTTGKPALQLQACKDDEKKHPDGCSWKQKDDRATSPLVVERVTVVSSREYPISVKKDWRQQDLVVLAPGAKIDIYHGGGASLCHRTVDGRETREPLWPWPMQDRIKAASERSKWATADVMGELTEMFGPPPPDCTR